MGIYLDLYRLPTDPAADVLAGRRAINVVEHERQELSERCYTFWHESLPKEPPLVLDFQKRYVCILDATTGVAHARYDFEPGEYISYSKDEPDDSYVWSVYGARIVGWREAEFPIEVDYSLDYNYPLRYSLPADVEAICRALGEMTEEALRQNVERVLEKGEDYNSDVLRTWMREQVVPKLLPAMRQFYEAALKEQQIVIYWMH